MITTVLIDDMPTALQLLKSDLESKHSEIKIIGTAKSVVEGAKLLRTVSPDILFLDIMLGDGTGFDLLEILPELNSKVIFVTASDEYAIRAFKFAAIDYILKPYSDEELASAIEKAKKQLIPDSEQLGILRDTLSEPNKKPKKISLHTLEKISVVDLDDIIRCQSDSNNTIFYLKGGQKIFVTKTLKYFADMLKSYEFIRVHQSHLINLQYVKEFIKTDGGYLILKNKDNVPVSVRKRAEVMEILSGINKN
ncbi:LytR/AlgR family response regulator transcription factor [Urechidicola croceus]|uniref:DNA-binding response regulator n=1 Tax=Urechidicola croceus TaxID=1850246 RepID=A0A1D8P4Q8_9FLAO|nr:LytTR family DNA-binding domain-containing protein [Urechidicola croceus]AOW19579.1 DNA-binding response regulator [Urechidicola croceus]